MTLSSSELKKSLELFEFVPGKKAAWSTLREFLPDIETALFFAKAYNMTYTNLSVLIRTLFRTSVINALMNGEHSEELQDYVDAVVPDHVWIQGQRPGFVPDVGQGDILTELWKDLEVTIAQSIAEVAEKLGNVLDSLPSKEGQMTFQHLNKLNRQRPTIGTYESVIKHQRQARNLVILDVSGSMSESTIRAIVEDVVALSYTANAYMAIVSDTAFAWEPGTYDAEDILHAAEYQGTHYEQLIPLLQEDWGTVVTIADYDSSQWAKTEIAQRCTGSVGKVVDISLVNQPTFLAECVGQLADEVQPILIGNSDYVLSR